MSPLSRQSVCLSDLVLNSDQHFRTDLLGQIHKVSDKGATSIPRHDEKYNGSQAAQCALYKEGFKISQISPKNHSLREMPTYFRQKLTVWPKNCLCLYRTRSWVSKAEVIPRSPNSEKNYDRVGNGIPFSITEKQGFFKT